MLYYKQINNGLQTLTRDRSNETYFWSRFDCKSVFNFEVFMAFIWHIVMELLYIV